MAWRSRGPRATDVDLGTVVERDVFRSYVTASGEIVATRFADVGSSTMGRIVELLVAEGQRVTAGQVLARLDPVQARSEVGAAVAQVAALEADAQAARQQVSSSRSELEATKARALETQQALDRTRQLHQQGLSPQSDLDAALAAANAAAAQATAAEATLRRVEQAVDGAARRIEQAKAQRARVSDVLSKTEIASPIAGVVTRLNVREGEMVVIGVQNQPGTILMTVSDLDAINAEVKVAEADVLRVRVGQPAVVTLDAMSGKTFAGTVVEVGASALPVVGAGAAAREFRVVVRLDRPDPGLRPGLTCDAEILTDERAHVATVPLQAVVLRRRDRGAESTGVFTIVDGRAVFTPVQTGIIGGLDIEVSGVAVATDVVIGPFQTLRTLEAGALVRGARRGGE